MGGAQTVDDRYRVLRELGRGGGGTVHLVEDRVRGGAPIALKTLSGAGPERAAALRREFALLAALRHPTLAEVFDLTVDPVTGLPRFSMEHIDGADLPSAIGREGPEVIADLAAEALRALGFLHAMGFVHRDVKPGNLLVRHTPRLGCRVVVLDFGLALRGGEEQAPAAGTLPYLAPELWSGGRADARSDLYALGAVLHEAVHGAPPVAFEGDLTRFVEAVRAGQRSAPPLPPGWPAPLGPWLQAMMATDPADRPADAGEALARLASGLGRDLPFETAAGRAARLASGPPPGREEEVAALWTALERPGPRLVWLCGEAGSGKTRTVRFLLADAIARGYDVVSLVPGSDEAIDLDGWRARAQAGPLLVVADEAERLSPRGAATLERIAREGRAPAAKVLAAARPGEVRQPILARLLREVTLMPTEARLDLEPLQAEGVRALVERAAGTHDASASRVRWLLQASEGAAGVLESLLVAGAWEAGGRTRPPVPKPGTDPRLVRLAPETRRWLQAAAVLREASPERLAQLAGLSREQTAVAAEEARALGLARRRESVWSPRSSAVAAAVLAALDAAERTGLFRRAAEALSAERAEAWTLARLWAEAGETERAVEQALRAAQGAERANDPAEAAARLSFALARMGRRDPRRRGVRLRQGDARTQAGLNGDAARSFAAAVVLSTDRGQRAEARVRQAYALATAGHLSLAGRMATRAESEAKAEGMKAEEALAKRTAGIVLARQGKLHDALAIFERVAPMFEALGDVQRTAEILHSIAACHANIDLLGAEPHWNRALEACKTAGHESGRLKCLLGLAKIAARQRRLDDAIRLLNEVRSAGNLALERIATTELTIVAINEGRLDEALSLAKEARDASTFLGDPRDRAEARALYADVLLLCGRPAEASAEIRTNLEEVPEDLDPARLSGLTAALAQALLEQGDGDPGEIASLLEDSLRLARQRRARLVLLSALSIEMLRRAAPECEDAFDPVRTEFDAVVASGTTPPHPDILIRVDHARAVSLLRRGNPQGSVQAARSAIEQAERFGQPGDAASALVVLAEALETAGAFEASSEALARGRRYLEEAAARIQDPDVRRDYLRRPTFRAYRDSAPTDRTADRRLRALYDMIRALNSETDPEALLESILDMALQAVKGERGMILVREEDSEEFSIRLARNLEQETLQDAEIFSRGVVAQAGEGRSVLALDAGHDQRFRELRSVSLYGIRSLMCVPLRSRGGMVGAVYLDSRREGALFTPDDLRFLEAFADHAALALENLRARDALERENRRLQQLAETRVQFGNIVGRSSAMQRIFDLVERAASSHLPVLVLGESGTGKELVAKALHLHGPRRRRVFLSENCAAIPEALLESTLFGHTRGAFTGAERDKPGLFEQADSGTLFLDEVGDMPLSMQVKLLRVLQEGEVRRVGGEKTIKVDVRVVAATNRNLQAEVAAGRFREDLLFRLQVLVVQLPPLRERDGDLPVLVQHLLEKISKARGRPAPGIDLDVLELFAKYPWPGNIRQLENVLQRLALLAGDRPIQRQLLKTDPGLERLFVTAEASEPQFSLERTEKEQIRRALEAARGNREKAALMLGISRATIYRKIKDLKLR
jgi:transcriptional regulator with GAF, ATPase, and Fis domain/predicted negative regulator of RcsB-dependent stress response